MGLVLSSHGMGGWRRGRDRKIQTHKSSSSRTLNSSWKPHLQQPKGWVKEIKLWDTFQSKIFTIWQPEKSKRDRKIPIHWQVISFKHTILGFSNCFVSLSSFVQLTESNKSICHLHWDSQRFHCDPVHTSLQFWHQFLFSHLGVIYWTCLAFVFPNRFWRWCCRHSLVCSVFTFKFRFRHLHRSPRCELSSYEPLNIISLHKTLLFSKVSITSPCNLIFAILIFPST